MIILDPIAVSAPGVFVSSNVPEDDAPIQSLTRVYAAGDRIMDPAAHMLYDSKVGVRAPVTISIASPGVINCAAHGLVAGVPVSFASTGALPTGLLPNVVYFVVAPTTNAYSVSGTVGGAAIAFTGSQSGVHNVTAGQNFNRPLTDKTYWLPAGATNRWKMLDTYNNTQTERAESIVLNVKPLAIAQGIFLGNVDGAEIVITSTDPVAGTVYSQATSMQTSNSGSSFYRWLFGRRRRKSYFLTLDLPLYYNATVSITINKPGGVAKCGMCCIGPVEDIGGTYYGLGTDIKDYSTTRFNFDGTSETTERGFSKRMTIDVLLANDLIDYVQEKLAAARQRTLVYIGSKEYGSTVLAGKFSSFKNVIEGPKHSKMALQIEGTV
ncbi:hypothetical protein [Duganella aceris]|uniref:Baseplate protein J-like domain-containing protein n=1 Tax=Duganella aceris TaxID=2703883 RepID=A0ABX0FP65_9BURK|nr:hypothetical protein [Duganella aceris]NGZ86406.1 hypothetical protein [Duganella aceris]